MTPYCDIVCFFLFLLAVGAVRALVVLFRRKRKGGRP